MSVYTIDDPYPAVAHSVHKPFWNRLFRDTRLFWVSNFRPKTGLLSNFRLNIMCDAPNGAGSRLSPT